MFVCYYCYSHFSYISQRSDKKHLWFDEIYTVSQKKHPQHFQLYLENQLSNFNNFWHKYS